MNIFEKMFKGPTQEIKQTEEKTTVQAPAASEALKEPKTMEQIKEAVGEIQDLKNQRWDTAQKHRDTVEELRKLGVHEYNPDTAPRTETVKDILKPIEEELVAISTEINEKRDAFDLQPKREEVINTRLFRLSELKSRAQESFKQTPSGKQIQFFDDQIQHHHNQIDLYRSEIEQIKERRRSFFETDTVAHEYATTIDRIEYLEVKLQDMLTKSKKVGYDDNGINSI